MNASAWTLLSPSRWQGRWAIWSSWEDDLNVSAGRQRAAWWAWLVLAVGALAVMVAVDHVDALRLQQDEVAEQVKRLSKADRQLRLQRALATQASQPASTGKPGALPDAEHARAPVLEKAALPAARRMVDLLAYPWPAHLNLVDAKATDAQVVMSQLSASLDNGQATVPTSAGAAPRVRWQLRAFVKDDTAALAWARQLPQGELLNREPAAQPFTTRAGTYALQVSLELQP